MNLFIFRAVIAFVLSGLITLNIIPLIMQVAARFNILDVPDGTIKKHATPVPYLGGIAIYLGFIATLALLYSFENQIALLLIGATLLLFLGLIDDLIRLHAYQKFAGQFIVCFCFLKSGIYLKEVFFLNNIWGIPLSLFWILSIINAFNLVDVMDGLATILALCATISFCLFSLILNQPHITILLSAFLGPLCAFFMFNKSPARIYLGDAGSLYIGGFLATIPFLLPWSKISNYGYVIPVMLLAVPLLEVLALVAIRTYRGIPFYKASPDHFSMYLQSRGWNKNTILAFAVGFSALFLVIALSLIFNIINLFSLSLLVAITCLLCLVLIYYNSFLYYIS